MDRKLILSMLTDHMFSILTKFALSAITSGYDPISTRIIRLFNFHRIFDKLISFEIAFEQLGSNKRQ